VLGPHHRPQLQQQPQQVVLGLKGLGGGRELHEARDVGKEKIRGLDVKVKDGRLVDLCSDEEHVHVQLKQKQTQRHVKQGTRKLSRSAWHMSVPTLHCRGQRLSYMHAGQLTAPVSNCNTAKFEHEHILRRSSQSTRFFRHSSSIII
jgi:hypothetical protein